MSQESKQFEQYLNILPFSTHAVILASGRHIVQYLLLILCPSVNFCCPGHFSILLHWAEWEEPPPKTQCLMWLLHPRLNLTFRKATVYNVVSADRHGGRVSSDCPSIIHLAWQNKPTSVILIHTSCCAYSMTTYSLAERIYHIFSH